ncbi:hypothetical protein [Streptomyces sp. YGL11-2]|uniref:hypothetical protein n=1 Tax=Streptomyces sp. YGL11-2 TaxID=3414028 RepID=UPI003CF0DD9F
MRTPNGADATAACFDGRASVEFILTGLTTHRADRITWVATELGYTLGAEEPYGRGQIRLRYVRDDSPPARQRAQAALDRVRAAGSWGAVTAQPWPTAQPLSPSLMTPLRAARAARTAKACETASPGLAAAVFVLVALACFAMAGSARTAAGSAVPSVVGLLWLAMAALTPRCTRRVHEKNLRLLEDFRRQQTARFPVPPPAPPPRL